MKKTIQLAAIACFLLLATASSAPADSASIVLTSASNGEFDYVLNAPLPGTTFLYGQGVTFTGLSGVTSASVVGNFSQCLTVTSLSSTSVTFLETVFSGFCTAFDPNEDFVIDSAVHNLGTVDWSMQVSVGPGVEELLTGTVPGPAGLSAVPEPSTLVFLGSALTGLLALNRKRKV